MALINCPECGRENVSDSAEACPGCGFGVREYFEKKKKEDEKKNVNVNIESIIKLARKPKLYGDDR